MYTIISKLLTFPKRLLRKWHNIRLTSIRLRNQKQILLNEIASYQQIPITNPPQFHKCHVNGAVLKTKQEYIDTVREIASLGLAPYRAPIQKTWDSLAALSAILTNTPREGAVLDAGSIFESKILLWLTAYNYENLIGINLSFGSKLRIGNIQYQYGDLTKTAFDDNSFDAITCLSVIEHGVDIDAYLKEMSRILKPGGMLITSADYWSTNIDTDDVSAFGAPWCIFSRKDILAIIDRAKYYGLILNSGIDLDTKDTIIEWFYREYTFIYFVLYKDSSVSAPA